MQFGFSVRRNEFPRLFSETESFLEDSETPYSFRDMFENSFTVSGARKPNQVFDKKYENAKVFQDTFTVSEKVFTSKGVPEETFRFSKMVKGFREYG